MSTQVDGALPGLATVAVHTTRFAAPPKAASRYWSAADQQRSSA